MAHYFQKQQDKLFEDDYAWGLLKIMYERHPDSTDLPIHNQKVKLLEQYALITRVSNQKLISWYDDLNDPYFPYVLQPVAEEKLKEKLN